ncbi:MAG: AAA family ATPase [Desulfarculus sp.]|nr:AAA family ATPase [Pseudomonadota bacterium]MBV1715457.1 AAA family ATPase [Desulfarculus sp.]MBU4576055.1 AAA family ATPase [Pseudomonadota bacterium]MBU4599275.1 AAA family ATPase [Pseudomonadota bacterium]MBV1739696.1 AAA family ATPase [Desulfarculus sp.]
MEQAQTDPQVLQALGRVETYPHPVESIEHLQTHISHIFLTGPMAYKLKKPVDLGFLDFRGLEERKRFCLEELRLNRRLAPAIYLQVLAVVRRDGGLALAPWEQPGGEVLEYVVQMVQMDQERMMDRLLDQGAVTPEQVCDLARLLARFYASEPGGPQVSFAGRPSQVRLNVEENFRQTEDYQGICVSPRRWRAVRDYSLGFLREHRELFKQRVAQGRVVDGHGDLHSGNINLPGDGPPIVFDCIEFNQRFRWQDAACDLAFLAMDLDHHGRRDLREVLVSEYITAGGDRDLLRVLDFYMCYRAVVRAKVYGFMHEDPGLELAERFRDLGRARSYFRQAAGYAGGEPPYFLVCFMGLMGTGKSYLAKLLAQATGWPRLSSDVVRKQRAGMSPGQASRDAWGQGLYGPSATTDTYEALARRAGSRLEMGGSVIVDASFTHESWRERFLELAAGQGATPLLVEVHASPQVVAERLARREAEGSSPSDGRLELVAAQAASWQEVGPQAAEHLLRVDGGAGAEAKMAMLIARLDELGYIPENHIED